MRTTGFGLIGLGRWGRRLADVLRQEGRLLWCCSTPGGEGARWAREHLPGVRWTGDADELIGAADVDAVAIATPVRTHAALAERALAGGKHVFVEKPLATDAALAERVRRLADGSPGALVVDYTFLFDTNITRLVELTRDDPPRRISLRWAKWGTFQDPILWNLFPHDVALSLALIDETPFRGAVTGDPADPTCHRSTMTLSYRSGRIVDIGIDRKASALVKELRVVTDSGKEYLWRDGELLSPHRDPVPLHPRGTPALANAVRHFVDVAGGRAAPRSDAAFAARVTGVLSGVESR